MNQMIKSVRSIATLQSSRLGNIANSDCLQEDEDDDDNGKDLDDESETIKNYGKNKKYGGNTINRYTDVSDQSESQIESQSK